MRHLTVCAALLLSACSREAGEADAVTNATAQSGGAAANDTMPPSEHVDPDAPVASPQTPSIGAEVARAEWRKAANRESCAPLALTSDGGAPAPPRRAHFSGGWGVAFDRPDNRSAYGFAGAGSLPEDRDSFAEQVDRIEKQWPYARRWKTGENLPAGSFAGFGLQGAAPYPAADPDGRGQQSGAYLRIPGQQCLYNVWSKLGRAHLEVLLDSLVVIPR